MEPDFSGYVTKAGLRCTDGRTIMPDAFKHQDKAQVPLVWQHGHKDPENVLGHMILEHREDGVYGYGYFNSTPKAEHARRSLEHKDINMMSIWANQLIERSKSVLHGAIREVSLVLAGANPGALIENVTIRHSDGDEEDLEGEAIIYTGLPLVHAADTDSSVDEDKQEDKVAHEDGEDTTDDTGGDESVKDIYETMTEKQQDVLHYMVGEAIAATAAEADSKAAEHSDDTEDDAIDGDDKEGSDMKHNVFEGKDDGEQAHILTHDDMKGIFAAATKMGSMKDAVESYALAHNITDVDQLFPEAAMVGDKPEFVSRRQEWVAKVLGDARKSPFSRIKTISADLTEDEARAKGYVTGEFKKEEFFPVARRITTPTTVYKKQSLDRDDVVDITDFDVVAWLKAEMRLMLDEELARAALIGDGRDISDEDKIPETNIRPVATDHELYTTVATVNVDDASSSSQEIIDAIVRNRRYYKGTGLPTMYTSETIISNFLLLKDTLGRRIYDNLSDLAAELRVSELVPVEVLEGDDDILAILVNMNDYVFGATRGGEVTMFDDFDIDYNKQKYLIETRCCGALTMLKSAIVIKKTAGANVVVTPNEPTFNTETGVLTIVNQTGVVYKNGATVVNAAGSPYAAIAEGASITIDATPASGYYFPSSEDDSWTFTREEA